MTDLLRQLPLPFLSDVEDRIGRVEERLEREKVRSWIGLDEAGRGPLAGPVVAAAVRVSPGFRLEGLDDSKKLTPSERERLFPLIVEMADSFGVGIVMPERIDRINILEATLEAMMKAVALAERRGGGAELWLVDGNRPLPTSRAQRTLVGGDRKSLAIAAASVLAKVIRDRWMCCAARRYPGYDFERHMGYPTRLHVERLRRLGPSAIHRKTFKGVL